MKRALVIGAVIIAGYTVFASLWNRGYIAGAVEKPLPNRIGNWFGLR